MPRVGLNHEGYEKVKAYLTEVGDPSKAKAREALGPLGPWFLFLFTLLAFLWKKSSMERFTLFIVRAKPYDYLGSRLT